MLKQPMPLLQALPLPKGTEAFEKRRAELIQELNDSIPEELYLPQETINNAPLNITGIPRSSNILNERELEITEVVDATALAQRIREKVYSSVEVAVAFCKRAAIAQQLTCCLTQFFMQEAIERAQFLDEYLEREGKVVGRLHGVPVSVKEHMMVKGHFSSFGFLSTRTPVPDDHDAPLIATLRAAGAVFYVKTNQPQGIMHLETDSWYGRTLNPHNINLSAGGSTGGEAALIAMRGSILGIGTDIGGSIRGPSAFCGIWGFKPTTYTLTTEDMNPGGFAAELNVLVSIGPMARSLRDVNLFMDLQISANHHLHDPRIIPLPWSPSPPPSNRKIKIGIMWHDGDITPQPPVLAALGWARELLAKHPDRFDLKPYTPYKSSLAMELITEAYWPDNGLNTFYALEATGEPTYPLTKAVLALPSPTPTTQKTASDVSALRVKRDNFRSQFARHFNSQDIDVVLAPCFVGPASKHDTAVYWNYTALWNYVDYPGIVFPTPIKAEGGMEYAEGYVPLSERCKAVREMWEEGGFENAPVNLQVVGRRYADSELIGVVGELEKVLKG